MVRPSVCDDAPLSFDIFCRVIDNYGDIGVCWRLARQLAQPPFSYKVRLWVDDLDRFKTLQDTINPALTQQTHCAVDIVRWNADVPSFNPHSVVIEAFGCAPPQSFIDAMVVRDSLWLNLEYLSAETWVEGFHLQPSIQNNGLRKYFFFPGFTDATGGLLREHGLIKERRRWQSSPEQRSSLLQRCTLSSDDISAVNEGARLIFLFCYPDAPVNTLIDALSTLSRPSVVLIPEGIYPPATTGQNMPDAGKTAPTHLEPLIRVGDASPAVSGKVRLCPIPFVDQHDFDRLLWSCDLNIVRGEDSLVRALWAARPMIWQPYRQDDNVHITKLNAWLARSPLHQDTQALIQSWTQCDLPLFREQFSSHQQPATWTRWTAQSRLWTEQLAAQTDLATSLVQFCTQQLRTG